jgi:hypothetical protein
MRKNFRWALAAAIGGVIESWGVAAFSAGVGFVTGIINAILAYDTGLPYYQVVLVFALTFGGISTGLFLISVPLLRYIKLRREKEQPADSGAVTRQQLKQSGVHVEVNPVISAYAEGGRPQRQRVPEPPRKTPVFERRGARIVTRILSLDERTFVREEYHGAAEDLPTHLRFTDAALARFYYCPDEGVDNYLYVTAHIFFHTPDVKLIREVFETVWDGPDNSDTQEFYTARAHNLIVALMPVLEPDRAYAYEHAEEVIDSYIGTVRNVKPNLYRLEGDAFLVKVELIAKRMNEFRGRQSFWFSLTLRPNYAFVEIEPPLS